MGMMRSPIAHITGQDLGRPRHPAPHLDHQRRSSSAQYVLLPGAAVTDPREVLSRPPGRSLLPPNHVAYYHSRSFRRCRDEASANSSYDYRPLVMEYVKGYFTVERNIVGLRLRQIEATLGFRPGRLTSGARVLVLQRQPSVGEFVFAGSTRYPNASGLVGVERRRNAASTAIPHA